MNTPNNILRTMVLFGVAGVISSGLNSAFAQDFDDIYYNPAKDKSKTTTNVTQSKQTKTATTDRLPLTVVPDYPAADTYNFNTGLARDVDEYNRRTPEYSGVALADTTATDDEFEYTRRIERFHNPDVVVNTNDEDLIDYYYNTEPASPSVVNIYIDNGPLWSWRNPYYYSSWAWNSFYDPWWNYAMNSAWYDPWYSWNWGPTWTWGPSWGWGPSFGWNWGWNWGWNNPWRPGPPPGGWAHNWYPPTPSGPGASRPHPGTGSGIASSATRPSTNGGGLSVRPGTSVGSLSGANANTLRPASSVRGRYPSTSTSDNTVTRWPASVNATNTATRPGSSVTVPSSTSTRGRDNVNSTPTRVTNTQPSNNSYNSTARPASTSTRNSFSTGSSSTRSSVGGSSPMRSTGGSSGGATRGRR